MESYLWWHIVLDYIYFLRTPTIWPPYYSLTCPLSKGFLVCSSIPFFLMMVTKGIMHIATPIISTIELLIRVCNSLIGVKMKLWFSIESSSCKKVSIVELLEGFISQSFFKWLNSLFAGLMRPFDIVYSLPISIEGWNCVF